MKKFITGINGGMPLRIDTLELIQTNCKELVSSICKGLAGSNTAIILYGCEIVVTNSGSPNPTLAVSQGAIYYNDEVFEVVGVSGIPLVAGATQSDAEALYWDLNIVDYLTLTFKDTSIHNIHTDRTAVLTSTPATWVGVRFLKTVDSFINKQVKTSKSVTQQSASLYSGNVYYNVDTYTAYILKDEKLNTLNLKFQSTLNSSMGSPLTLGLKYQIDDTFVLPFSGSKYLVYGTVNGTNTLFVLEVDSNTPSTFIIKRFDNAGFNANEVITMTFISSYIV